MAQRSLRRAQQWQQRGEPVFAERAMARALTLAPDNAELLRMHALLLHELSRYTEAAEQLRKAIRVRPASAELHNNLGSAFAALNAMQEAIREYRRSCELDPHQPLVWFNLGKAHDALHETDDAEHAFSNAIAYKPDYLEAIVLHAETLRTTGRIDDAIAEFRMALQLDPDCIEAWADLIGLKATRPQASDIERLENLYQRESITDDRRATAGFVYGLALEAAARYEEAFKVFVAANKTLRRSVRWDARVFSEVVDSIVNTFGNDMSSATDSSLGKEVIFLFGMPRSGSTLTEQILSAHPDVEGAGEIGVLKKVIRDESARRDVDYSEWASDATPEDWARLGAEYLRGAAEKHSPDAIRFTDKSLSNWQLAGAAHAMLPGARFIDCRREPIESCWSCFKVGS